MGRQWLQAKREVANLKKGMVVGKLVKEIMVAAKVGGGPDPAGNARLFAAVEKARRASVTRDAIDRAIKKGAGVGEDKLTLDHVVFEGYAPHKVPVVVEVFTDNQNRTARPRSGCASKADSSSVTGSNKFLFDHRGIVEGASSRRRRRSRSSRHRKPAADEVEPLAHAQNDDIRKPARRRAVSDRPRGSPRRFTVAGG